MIAQVSFGLPVYIGLALLAGTLLHRLETRTTRATVTEHGLALATA